MFEKADAQCSEVNRRRQNFRNQVRRNQIQEYFDRCRKELLVYGQSKPQSHRQILDTPQKRAIFLDRIECQLRETDANNWPSILQQINISVGFFERDFNALVQTQILKIICNCAVDPISDYNLRLQIIRTLILILKSERQDNQRVAGYILYYRIVFEIADCFVILYLNSMPLHDVKQYLHFFACFTRLSQKYRNSIIQRVGSILVQYGNKLLTSQFITDEQMRFSFLGICGDFLKSFPNVGYKIQIQFASSILVTIDKYIQLPSQQKTIEQGLRCLEFISRYPNHTILMGFTSNTLIKNLFQFSKTRRYHIHCLRIFNRLIQDERMQISTYLLKIGILDLLYDITKQQGLTTQNSIPLILLLHNLGHEDERAIEKIITHPVWKLLVIPSMTQYNHKLKQEAYFCVNQFLSKTECRALQLLIIQNGQIVFKSIDIIKNYSNHHKELTYQALILLKIYIKILAEQQQRGGQAAVQSHRRLIFLEKVFNVESLIDQILNISQSQKLLEQASTISQIYGAAFMLDGEPTP